MFVSQVTFSCEDANEEVLRNIMKNKTASAQKAEGIVSAECWTSKENDGKVSYSLVCHWRSEEDFKEWMKAEHKPENRANRPVNGQKSEITRSGKQYTVVEL